MASKIIHEVRPMSLVLQHGNAEVHGETQMMLRAQEKDPCPSTDWIVQKFGGTSLGKCVVTIVEDIILYVVARDFRIPTS